MFQELYKPKKDIKGIIINLIEILQDYISMPEFPADRAVKELQELKDEMNK